MRRREACRPWMQWSRSSRYCSGPSKAQAAPGPGRRRRDEPSRSTTAEACVDCHASRTAHRRGGRSAPTSARGHRTAAGLRRAGGCGSTRRARRSPVTCVGDAGGGRCTASGPRPALEVTQEHLDLPGVTDLDGLPMTTVERSLSFESAARRPACADAVVAFCMAAYIVTSPPRTDDERVLRLSARGVGRRSGWRDRRSSFAEARTAGRPRRSDAARGAGRLAGYRGDPARRWHRSWTPTPSRPEREHPEAAVAGRRAPRRSVRWRSRRRADGTATGSTSGWRSSAFGAEYDGEDFHTERRRRSTTRGVASGCGVPQDWTIVVARKATRPRPAPGHRPDAVPSRPRSRPQKSTDPPESFGRVSVTAVSFGRVSGSGAPRPRRRGGRRTGDRRRGGRGRPGAPARARCGGGPPRAPRGSASARCGRTSSPRASRAAPGSASREPGRRCRRRSTARVWIWSRSRAVRV